MRQLSFQSFLKRTLRDLSMDGNTAVFQLAKELPENPRLLEPLCLYAATLKEETRAHLLQKYPVLGNEYAKNSILMAPANQLEAKLEAMEDSGNTYRKLWNSYVSVRDRQEADNHTKLLIHTRIRKLQQDKGISNYRVYTDLHLNPGNLNAFLTRRNCDKVSLNTARLVLQYLRKAECSGAK